MTDDAASLQTRLAAAERVVDAAKNQEWSASSPQGHHGVCPECCAYEHEGHATDCELGAALAGYDAAQRKEQ